MGSKVGTTLGVCRSKGNIIRNRKRVTREITEFVKS